MNEQEKQLSRLQKERHECTIMTTNGVPMKGIIVSHDNYVILLQSSTGKINMLYKHAVSTVIG